MTVKNNNRCNYGPNLCLNIECTDMCPANPRAWDAAKKVMERQMAEQGFINGLKIVFFFVILPALIIILIGLCLNKP